MFLATVISRVCEPFVLLLMLVVITLLQDGMPMKTFFRVLTVIVIGIIVPPLLALVGALRNKTISNWDISNRKQRVWALGIFFLFLIFDYFLIRALGITSLSRLFLFLSIVFLGFFLVTLVWKMSGHLTFATIFVGIIIYLFGGFFWILLVMLPFLSWSRVILKRHTVGQVIGGMVYGGFMVYIGIYTGLIR